MTNLIGKTLQSGKYILDQELGQGGFGITYKATNSTLNQVVVIKTLSESLQQEPMKAKLNCQFEDEAKRLAKCSHPNIVRVSDFFIEEELPYIVMEYIPGLTLDRIVLPDKPLPEATAIHYIRQVGEALKVVHQQGLLHRDISPKNIILRQGIQQVVLIDFGIAREFEPGSVQIHTNLVSEGYAPIEQYFPKAVRTSATDVYGLAATFYTLLTGKIPLSAIPRYNLPSLDPRQICSELSDLVSQAVMCGTALEVEHRSASVDEWLALLPQTTSPPVVKMESKVLPCETADSASSVTIKPIIHQQSVKTEPNTVKQEHLLGEGEEPKGLLGIEEDRETIKLSSKKLDLAPLNVVSSFLNSPRKKVMLLGVTTILPLGGLLLTGLKVPFPARTLTKENIKEIEPEKSPPPTLNTTVGFPINDTPTIPVVDEIPSLEDKPIPVQPSATENLSETLPQKQEPVIEKSQSPTPTPINQAPLVEPKKVPNPSETGVRKTKPEKQMKRRGKGKGKGKGKNK